MLTSESLERMLAAPSVDDAAKVLVDCGYEDMSGMSASEIETVLSARRAVIFHEIATTAPESGIIDAFRIKYDYHNAKAVIKSRGIGTDAGYIYSDSGRISAATIEEAYDSDIFRFIPNALGASMTEAKGILARTNNPQLADLCLDKAYFTELKQIAESMSGSFMQSYVRTLIDSANLRAAVRIMRLGRGMEFMRSAMIEGGTVGVDRLAAAAVDGAMADLFSSGIFNEAAGLGDSATHGGALTAFEMACDNAVVEFLKSSKIMSFGDAPVIAYIAAVENEITAVRMILTGRLAGVSPDSIRERLRVSYA